MQAKRKSLLKQFEYIVYVLIALAFLCMLLKREEKGDCAMAKSSRELERYYECIRNSDGSTESNQYDEARRIVKQFEKLRQDTAVSRTTERVEETLPAPTAPTTQGRQHD